jgi:2-dehydropantoate 2-reductase
VRTPSGGYVASVRATDDPRALGDVELAVVAVKGYSLGEVVPAVRTVAERGAAVLPLLNGVEAAERLVAAGVPACCVVGGLTEISAARIAPGIVERRSSFQRVVLGELVGGRSERVGRIAATFAAAGADASVSESITVDLWRKFGFIAAMAAACGLARAPVGPVRAAPFGRLLFERAVAEVLLVGRARGIVLPEGEEEKILAFIASLPDGLKPSFLLDLEAGGANELDDLCGAVSRLGRSVGVETPVHDTASAALAAARPGATATLDR